MRENNPATFHGRVGNRTCGGFQILAWHSNHDTISHPGLYFCLSPSSLMPRPAVFALHTYGWLSGNIIFYCMYCGVNMGLVHGCLILLQLPKILLAICHNKLISDFTLSRFPSTYFKNLHKELHCFVAVCLGHCLHWAHFLKLDAKTNFSISFRIGMKGNRWFLQGPIVWIWTGVDHPHTGKLLGCMYFGCIPF